MHKILKGPLHINLDAKIMIVPMHMHKITVRGTICINVEDFIPFIISFPYVIVKRKSTRQQHGKQTAKLRFPIISMGVNYFSFSGFHCNLSHTSACHVWMVSSSG